MSSSSSQTRTRILQSTWRLLETGNHGRTRMSDIAKAAGISRQALYLHFPNRADLLVATTRYLDEVNNVDGRLAASRAARTGIDRLAAFIDAWGNYIPEIYGVAAALMAMQDTDESADLAWRARMQAVREGCEAAVRALHKDGMLAQTLTVEQATDLLWTLTSVRNWEQLTLQCGWSQDSYVAAVQSLAAKALVADQA